MWCGGNSRSGQNSLNTTKNKDFYGIFKKFNEKDNLLKVIEK